MRPQPYVCDFSFSILRDRKFVGAPLRFLSTGRILQHTFRLLGFDLCRPRFGCSFSLASWLALLGAFCLPFTLSLELRSAFFFFFLFVFPICLATRLFRASLIAFPICFGSWQSLLRPFLGSLLGCSTRVTAHRFRPVAVITPALLCWPASLFPRI